MDLHFIINPTADGAQPPPQRTSSLAIQPHYNSHSPVSQKTPSLPRTTSLPTQTIHYRRESTASVSPKTMPPPAPMPFQTPSPVLSRKRSLSISDHQYTPQPALKKRRYDSPPPWARRERDGYQFVLTPRSEPPRIESNVAAATSQATRYSKAHQINAPPSAAITPHPPDMLSPYEPGLDNHEPYNDLERQVCDFLFQNIVNRDWNFNSATKVEVEAKLGRLTEHGQRLRIPVLTETVLQPGYPMRFESLMDRAQHANLNKYLNSTVQQSMKPGRRAIQYEHLRETDTFYDMPARFLDHLDPVVRAELDVPGRKGSPRIRVTTDQATGQIKAIIVKTRLQDMEVYCPADEFDYRISISLETPWPVNPIENQFPEHLDQGVRTARGKDRLSYKHQGFQVDLTQVTPLSSGPQGAIKIHELEIEMDVDKLQEEGYKNLQDQPNDYTKLVHVFLNNVKLVNRAARVR